MTAQLTRNFHEQVFDSAQYQNHPELVGRILFFVLPVAVLAIVWVTLWKKVERVISNYDIIPIGEQWLRNLIWIIAFVALAVTGIEAIADNAWTTKAWILFTFGVAFLALWILIYQFDSHLFLDLAAIVSILSFIAFQWLWIEINNMPNANDNQDIWRHISRNFIGFLVGANLVVISHVLGQIVVYQLNNSFRCQEIFFWIFTPAALVALVIWDVTSYPPFIDAIGVIAGGVIMLMNSLITTIKSHERERLLEKPLK